MTLFWFVALSDSHFQQLLQSHCHSGARQSWQPRNRLLVVLTISWPKRSFWVLPSLVSVACSCALPLCLLIMLANIHLERHNALSPPCMLICFLILNCLVIYNSFLPQTDKSGQRSVDTSGFSLFSVKYSCAGDTKQGLEFT